MWRTSKEMDKEVTAAHFGVYGVILSEDKSQILVVKKTRGPYTGWYDLPGGAMNEGETEEETLQREIMEETGAAIVSGEPEWQVFDISVERDSSGNNIQFRHQGKWKFI